MTSFDSYDFSSDPKWKQLESQLYIPPGPDHDALLKRRQRRYYRDNVDATYSWTDEPLPSAADAGATSSSSGPTSPSSSSSSAPPFQSFRHHDHNASSASSSSSSSASSESSSSSSSSSSSRPSSSSSSSSARNNRQAAGGRPTLSVVLSYTQLALHLLTLLLFPFVLLPFLYASLSQSAFSYSLYASGLAYICQLLQRRGVPSLSKQYWLQLLQDDYFHFFFYAFICLSASPNAVFVLPFVLRSALYAAGALGQLLPRYAPSLAASVAPTLNRFYSTAPEIARTCAVMEVCALFYCIALLLTPSRSFLLVFLMYQFLRMRYLMSDDSRFAWTVVQSKLEPVVYAAWMPQLVRSGYDKLKRLLWQQVDPDTLQQGGGGMLSRCTIM
jgi:hypothetical protein